MKKIAVLLSFLMLFVLIAPVVSQATTPTQVKILQNSVRLRTQPTTSSAIVTTTSKGTSYPYLGTTSKDASGYAWYKIQYTSSAIAYVRSDLASLITAQEQTATVAPSGGQIKITSPDGINIRSQAGTWSKLLGVVPKDAVISYDSQSGSYYHITYQGITGYIHGYYTVPLTQTSSGSVTASTPSTVLGQLQITSPDGLNLRSAASASGTVIGLVPKDAKVPYDALVGSWYHITYNGKAGYIYNHYTKPVSTTTETSTVTTPSTPAPTPVALGSVVIASSTGLRLREGASTTSAILAVVPNNTVVKYYDQNATWYQVSYSGKLGWIYKAYTVSASEIKEGSGQVSLKDRQEAWLNWAPGKFLDPDKNGVSWCTDTINQYALDLFGAYRGISNGGNAKDLLTLASADYFQKIYFNVNDPSTYPKRGDIVAWGGSYSNPAGHAAIVMKDATTTAEALSVLHSAYNFSPYDAAAITTRPYSYSSGSLVGLLRPIASKITATHPFGTK